jgi:carbonic anhydrase
VPRIVDIPNRESIPSEIAGGPVGLLLEYHNLNRPHDSYLTAQLLIGMCMDHRKRLRIPDHFAYILRSGGANLRASEFAVSYAISIGGIRAIALVTHTQCGMVNLNSRRSLFIEGLIEGAGWDRAYAEGHFSSLAPEFEISNEAVFAVSEAMRLRLRYPRVQVVPLLYRIEDGSLYLLQDE